MKVPKEILDCQDQLDLAVDLLAHQEKRDLQDLVVNRVHMEVLVDQVCRALLDPLALSGLQEIQACRVGPGRVEPQETQE